MLISINRLQFSYNGKTSTLGSAGDIAAWIEERRKRFPTKARVAEAAARKAKAQEQAKVSKERRREENRKKQEESRKRQEEIRKRQEEKQRAKEENQRIQDENRRKKEERKKLHEENLKRHEEAREAKKKKIQKEDKPGTQSIDAATKERLKLEKLKRALEKSEKRVAEMEARQKCSNNDTHKIKRSTNSEDTNGISESSLTQEKESSMLLETTAELRSNDIEDLKTGHDADYQMIPQAISVTDADPPLTPRSEPLSPKLKVNSKILALATSSEVNHPDEERIGIIPDPLALDEDSLDESDDSLSISSISVSLDDETTSSSGSSEDDADSAPEEKSSTHRLPSRVPPPPRIKPNQKPICRQFLKFGRCSRGRFCTFRHEKPESAKDARKRKEAERENEDRPLGGMTLHQRLMARQQEEEAEAAVKHTLDQGGQGALEEPKPESKVETKGDVLVEAESRNEPLPDVESKNELLVETGTKPEDQAD